MDGRVFVPVVPGRCDRNLVEEREVHWFSFTRW
jgi:hypothetical protein